MDVAALVALAGNTVVVAAVTDAWEDLRHQVARLFGRGEPDQKTERQLDATRAELASVAPGELERVRAELARDWAVRWKDLLAEHPEAEAELAALVREIQAKVPATADHSVVAGRDVIASADQGGVAAGVIHGDVTTGPTLPGPAGG